MLKSGWALSFAVSIIKIGLQVEKLWPSKDVEKLPVYFKRHNVKISCESFEGLIYSGSRYIQEALQITRGSVPSWSAQNKGDIWVFLTHGMVTK